MRTFSYKKLFKKLIDLDMTNNELMEKTNISKSTFYKIKNGQNVTTDILLRICNALDCDIEEILECVEDQIVIQRKIIRDYQGSVMQMVQI